MSPGNLLLRRVKEMASKKKTEEVAPEVEAAVTSTGIAGLPVLHTATGERKENTFSRQGLNGFTEIVDAKTGEVVARHEQG
jgi:hypothetical protein